MGKSVLTCVPVLGLFVSCVIITSWVCAHVCTFTAVCSGRGEVNCGLPSVNGMSPARYLDWVINSGSRHSYSHCQTAELLTPRIPLSLSLTLSPLSLFNLHTARLIFCSLHVIPVSVLSLLLFSHSRSLQTRPFFYYTHELQMWRSLW